MPDRTSEQLQCYNETFNFLDQMDTRNYRMDIGEVLYRTWKSFNLEMLVLKFGLCLLSCVG